MLRAILPLAVLLPGLAHAENPPLVKAIEARYAKVQGIEASFTQTMASSLYGANTQTGKVLIKRPTKMRWTFSDGKEFITDGKTMYVHNPAEKQVLKYADVSASTNGADTLLQSLDKLGELFEIEVLADSKDAKTLKLMPKGAKGQVQSIELSLGADLGLKEVGILDAFDTRTTLLFTDVKLDAKPADSAFDFKVPAGFELLEN